MKKFLTLVTNAAVSWVVTCGLLFLACWCFEVTITLKLATGVWLLMALARSVIHNTK